MGIEAVAWGIADTHPARLGAALGLGKMQCIGVCTVLYMKYLFFVSSTEILYPNPIIVGCSVMLFPLLVIIS